MGSMTVVRAELARQFYFGDDAVLLVMDTDGVTTFLSALVRAQQQGVSQLERGGTVHDFLIEPGAADIELHKDRVVWRRGYAHAHQVPALATARTRTTQ